MSLAQALSFSNACLGQARHNWTRKEVRALFQLPFPELIHALPACTGSISIRPQCRFQPCCRSRPATVRRSD